MDVALFSDCIKTHVCLTSNLHAKIEFSGVFAWRVREVSTGGHKADALAKCTYESNISAFGSLFHAVCFNGPYKNLSSRLVEDALQLIYRCRAKEDQPTMADVVTEMETWDLTTSRAQSPLPSMPADDDRAISPVSTAPSSSEPLLSQKVDGTGSHAKIAAPMTAIPTAQGSTSLKAAQITGTPPSSSAKALPPQWLTNVLQAMRAKYPKDRFELTTEASTGTARGYNVGNPKWRLECLDCPGELYFLNPGNYEDHLKNRYHRRRVAERLDGNST
ncbi:hypothetical protein M378DRAFT_296532 [Amanita muscaria Koide BX008]|uniref:Uncharacterized protein n=1 Tax=Amanita muscaria (strain Koide BX008) TaxID=946122 RepID=A0A0C2TJL5_AMAMK|nr:hypothetical protein M378DRAFT_296532 [Amanita muscaria Koide BX008]